MGTRSKLTDSLEHAPEFRAGYGLAQRNIALGTHIRNLRKTHGWTQAQLAAEVGTTQPDISRLEDGQWGERGLNLQMLDRVLRAFGLRMTHEVHVDQPALRSADEVRIIGGINQILHLGDIA